MPLRPDPDEDGAGLLRRLQRVLGDARVQQRLRGALSHVSRAHTVPHLVGSSQDARVAYVDSALPSRLLVGGSMVPVIGHLLAHERAQRSIMDGLGLDPGEAGALAQAGTAARVRMSGVAWRDWALAMVPYLRSEAGLGSVPPDLDVAPYAGDGGLAAHLDQALAAARTRVPPAAPDHLHVGVLA